MRKRKAEKGTGKASALTGGETKSKYFRDNEESRSVSEKAVSGESKEGEPGGSKGDGRLQLEFYDRPCVDLAKALLGKVLVRKLENDEVLKGSIVETEAYLGGEDKAAHSFNGKRTAKNEAMYMDPGTSYVYHIYGIYTCINVSSKGEGAAVLIRGMDPVQGLATMKTWRGGKRADKGKGLKDKDLGSGPSKLTQALDINKANGDQKDLLSCQHLWLEDGDQVPDDQIIECSRIGVDYAAEWAKKPLRFYVRGNKSVSVRNKKAEDGMPPDEETADTKAEVTPKGNKKGRVKAKGRRVLNSMKITMDKNYGQSSWNKLETINVCSDNCTDIDNPQDINISISPVSSQDRSGQPRCDNLNYTTSGGNVTSTCVNLHTYTATMRLGRTFFNQPCINLARALLGKTLVRTSSDGSLLRGFIVETEAYLGTEDGCCHSFSGRPTPKTRAMFMEPGTAYVYHVYYNYYCFNISSQGTGAVVLVRAVMPLEGMDSMREARGKIRSDQGKKLKVHQLGNGPSKLCMAFNISKSLFNEQDLVMSENLWLESSHDIPKDNIITSKRIGLKSADELWRNKPWRFYIDQNKAVSVI